MLLIQVLDCVKNTEVDTGIDIGDFVAFAENPGCADTSEGYEDKVTLFRPPFKSL